MLDFTSRDIIFHLFLELHTTSDKKDFHHKFSFLPDSLKPPPHPVNGQNLLSETKVCSWCSLRNSRENMLSPMGNLQICVIPLGNFKIENQTHGNSTWVFLEHSWKLHFFFHWPLESPHALASSIPLEILCYCLIFFLVIAHPPVCDILT